jgi:GT2 family glycosyltransferase
MKLSIIIVNWNTKALLASVLDSLEAATGDLTCEILVVDNASTDGSTEMVEERFPHVHLLKNAENVGFARANNQALTRSLGEYVLLLNSDTVVLPGALQFMLAFAQAHPTVGAIGPRLLNADGSLQVSCYPLLTARREFWRLMFLEQLLGRRATYDMAHWDLTRPRDVEVIQGACLLLRRDALTQVGFLDDRYFMYSEEMDLCYRLRQAGWQLCWVPQAKVIHYGGASSRKKAAAMYVQLYRSKVQFQRKFWGARHARYFKALLAFAYLPRWLVMKVAAVFNGSCASQVGTYERLLRELPRM